MLWQVTDDRLFSFRGRIMVYIGKGLELAHQLCLDIIMVECVFFSHFLEGPFMFRLSPMLFRTYYGWMGNSDIPTSLERLMDLQISAVLCFLSPCNPQPPTKK